MALSARNDLAGTVEEITQTRFSATRRARPGSSDRVGHRRSADGRGLKKGDRVTAVAAIQSNPPEIRNAFAVRIRIDERHRRNFFGGAIVD
jgi:hypothetical protein